MKYFMSVIAVIAVAFIAIVLVVNRSSRPTTSSPNLKGAVKLADYDRLNANVSLTIQGKLVGEQQRRAVRINVSPTERKLEILSGYTEQVERTVSYANTEAAYQAFLRALENGGFTKSRVSPFSDYRGVCPLGQRYIYDLSYSGEHLSNLWSTSCSGKEGTFAGVPGLMRQIFQAQIPDYKQQTTGVVL